MLTSYNVAELFVVETWNLAISRLWYVEYRKTIC